jgi:hypothetical protein
MNVVRRPLLLFILNRDVVTSVWDSLTAISPEITVYPLADGRRWATVAVPVHLLSVFERWLACQAPGLLARVDGGDTGRYVHTHLRDGRFVGIRPTMSPKVPVSDPPHRHANCPTCDHRMRTRRPEARPVIRFPRKPTTHFFLVDFCSVFASEVFLEALAERDLDTGLTAHPINEVHGSDLRWFWLSGRRLQEPPAPFGRWVPDCPTCGLVRPRYRGAKCYLPFDDGPVHWMDPAPYLTSLEPIVVSPAVYRWLLGPGARYLSPYQRSDRMTPTVFGRYPEEAADYYCPLAWHAADTVVEDPTVLPYMTADDLTWGPDPVPEPDPKWYTEALDKGKFTDLDQALGWEQDIVYALHLVEKDLGGTLRDEDVACFPNLNELVLRGTPLARVPDAVFGLRNLRRLDLRDTGLSEDEVARVRSRLRKGVTLQVSKAPKA